MCYNGRRLFNDGGFCFGVGSCRSEELQGSGREGISA